jgi:hypothetical protein
MLRNLVTAFLLTLLGIMLGAPASQSEPQTVKLDLFMIDYKFIPNHLTFERDVHYRLHMENHGKETHEVTAPTFFATAAIDNRDAARRRQGLAADAAQARHLRSALLRSRLERHGRRHNRRINAGPLRRPSGGCLSAAAIVLGNTVKKRAASVAVRPRRGTEWGRTKTNDRRRICRRRRVRRRLRAWQG